MARISASGKFRPGAVRKAAAFVARGRRTAVYRIAASVAILLSVLAVRCSGADEGEVESALEETVVRDSPFVVAPMFLSNPSFGDGFGLATMYFYRLRPDDAASPLSIVGIGGLYSNTDSYFAGIYNSMFLDEDRWRLKMGVVDGRINHDLDVPLFGDVKFRSNVKSVLLGFARRVKGNIFVGLDASYRKISYSPGNAISKEYFKRFGVSDNSSGTLAIPVSYDSRDNVRFPFSGVFARVKPTVVPEWLGAESGYWSLEAEYNSYNEVNPKGVLAWRLYTRQTPSDTPFEGLSTLGRASDLRGYTAGENIANNLMTGQLEYRRLLTERFGVAAFGGLALLYDGAVTNVNSDSLFPSGGVGIRIVLHKESRQTFRVDYAWGEDDEDGLYVSIGEAF